MNALEWMTWWKLQGEPTELPLERLKDVPEEAFDEMPWFVATTVYGSSIMLRRSPSTGMYSVRGAMEFMRGDGTQQPSLELARINLNIALACEEMERGEGRLA